MSYLQLALKAIKKHETLEPKIRLVEKQKPDKPLEEILDSILLESRDKIIEAHEGKQYHSTDEIKASEDEIDRLYKAVLSGQGSLSEFQDAVNIWERRAIENVRK